MKLADRIILHLLKYGRKDPSEIMIPNFYHGMYEMDCFKLTKDELVVEYEVKISRADFFNDFKKYRTEYGEFHEGELSWPDKTNVYKHDVVRLGQGPNRFVFIVPENLVQKHEVPAYCGLMYFQPSGTMMHEGYLSEVDSIYTVRPAPMLHKRKYQDYKQLAKSLSWREERWRTKANKYANKV